MEEHIINLVLDGNIQEIKELLEKDIITKRLTRRIILTGAAYAAFINHYEILSTFMNIEFCNINDVLITAIEKSLANSIEVLYKHGADVNYEDRFQRNTLEIAINNHEIECIKQLIYFNINVNMINSKGDTILMYIAQKRQGDYTKELQLLVSNGAVVNLVNSSGESPLHAAVTHGNIKTANELIILGANVNSENCLGETPLMMASKRNNSSCVELLLSSGANPNTQSPHGETALMMSLRHVYTTQCIETVKLLDKITDLNLRDNYGDTVLFHAIYHNNIDVVQILLSNGADMYIKNIFGLTPFLLAVSQGHNKLAKYLIEMKCAISETAIDLFWCEYPCIFRPIIKQLDTMTNERDNCEELNKLFFGAGETVNMGTIHHPHYVAQQAMDTECILLKSIVRRTIRNYFLNTSSVNLIYKIRKLPLPRMLKEYLCFW